MRLVLLSDTHGHHHRVDVPPGDLLLFGGDLTDFGNPTGVGRFDHWLSGLPHRHKVIIAGNHDFPFVTDGHLLRHGIYLQDQAIEIEGLRIYGAPWQPVFCRMAFNLGAAQLREKWALIPDNLDVLMTHGPPRGILDRIDHGTSVGCAELAERVAQVQPKLHLFGHIHEGYGQTKVGATQFFNASICDLSMHPVNRPFVVDWDGNNFLWAPGGH